jgi:hypothetical protein
MWHRWRDTRPIQKFDVRVIEHAIIERNMTAEQCVAFLEALRCTQIRVKDNGWVEAACPLAKWLHKKHVDHTPSFGLQVAPGQRSWFMCFACRQGSAEELLSSIEMHSHMNAKYDFARCHQLLQDEEYVVPLPEYGEFASAAQVFDPWPQYWLDSFQKADWVIEAIQYLTHRGVSATTVQQYDLRWDMKRQMLVCPYRDVFGRLAGARGRAVGDATLKHYDYTWQGKNNARLCWYGEEVLNLPGPVVVVEGQFDLWKTATVFPKTVANLTAKPTLEKMKKLGDCGMVIQIPDRDEAGKESMHRYAKLCDQLELEYRPIWLDEGVKDPDECPPDYLKERILQSIAVT